MINFKKGKEHVCGGILEFLYSRFRKEEIGAAEAIPRIEESVTFKNLTEIRLRADLPVLIETTQENYFLKKEKVAEKRRAIAKEEDNWIL